jgi:hypothetical protein
MKRLLLLLTMCACEGLTTAPQPALSALKKMPEGCFALMTPSQPIAAALSVYGTCNYQADPTLMAGVDTAVIVVDYGPDVEFDTTTDVPPPAITVSIDGIVADVPVAVSDVQRAGTRAYFLATVTAPLALSNDVRFSAEVNPGFRGTLAQPFALVAPPLNLSLAECGMSVGCELFGGVGDAHLVLDVPGSGGQPVTVHTALDGIPQPDTLPVATSGTTVGVPVPAAPDGATWTISAQLAVGPAPSITTTLRAPSITTKLSCAPNCSLAPGDQIGLSVVAPLAIHATQALVTTRLDGVPQLVGEPVALDPGLLALTVPGHGTWTIDVTVAGYSAPAIVQTIP